MNRFIAIIGAIAAALALSACGDGDGGTTTGRVSFYVTDAYMDNYQSVRLRLRSVQLLHTGIRNACDIITAGETPVEMDITELAGTARHIGTAECGAGPYNRFRIVFDKQTTLVDDTGTPSDCAFTSYKDDRNRPNFLSCEGDITCTLDINGAVNVLAGRDNPTGLDFDLKEFEVSGFGGQGCSATMKVSPMHSFGMGGP